ncbi:replication-associated protein [Crucivirus-312]|nr:replication-associated protein [Crucivirus-312]
METVAKDTQVYRYDFTSYFDDIEECKKFLRTHCSKWTFQQEKCPSTGKLHLQGRVSLKTKKTLKSAALLFKALNNAHISKTSKNCTDDAYVMKNESRVAGPWKHDDKPPPYIPIQLRITEFLPWQKAVIEQLLNFRKINMVLDKKGNIGKTTLVGNLCCQNKARQIPFCNDFKDIMRMMMCMEEDHGSCPLVFIDLPRAIKKDHLYQMYSGIEVIKGGYLFDDRYHLKFKYIDSPNIWVFTNVEPEWSFMSSDRWIVWEVNKDFELVQKEPDGLKKWKDSNEGCEDIITLANKLKSELSTK